MWFEAHITTYEGVQGGRPVVVGTRTPVSTVAVLFHHVYPNDIKRVNDALPHLKRRQVEAALAYYEAHRCQIDEEIERDERNLREHAIGQ